MRFALKQERRNLHVYVVEDTEATRTALMGELSLIENLSLVGYSATSAGAVTGIAYSQPDVVLLDLNLASGSGWDVLAAVGRASRKPVIIVLTNHSEPQFRRKAIREGANFFFDKSTEIAGCLTTIRALARGEISGALGASVSGCA